jgi:recyclin-1
MERWTALLPDRPNHNLFSNNPLFKSLPKIKLIGKLPEAAYISIIQHLPIPDITSIALCSRQLSTITRSDTVWKFKVDSLRYSGPGAVIKKVEVGQDAQVALEAGVIRESHGHASLVGTSLNRDPQPASASSITRGDENEDDDDDFGDFFSNTPGGATPAAIEELPFDDFQDFNSSTNQSFDLDVDLLGLSVKTADGGDVAIQSNPPLNDDLMMDFGEEIEEGRPDSIPAAASRPQPPHPTPDSLPMPSTTFATSTSESYRDVYILHHNILLPYYLSLLTHTTSSLIFTSPNLTPKDRSRLFSALARFCSPLLAPTRSLPQRLSVLRNVQSACDFFESAMLAEFERADSRRDEVAMREKATILWELNGGSSVTQVFIQKREIFYDQSHNALSNLM